MKKMQQGWTMWSLLGVGFLLITGALLFMKLFPVYLDNYKLLEAMHSVAEDPRASEWNKRTIVREMDNILYIDYGSDIVDLNKSLTLESSDSGKFMVVQYEVVVPLVYNLSALVDFNNRVEIVK